MSKKALRFITRTAILTALTIGFQYMGFPQMVTGPVVNMFLLMAVSLVNVFSGIVVGIITPIMGFQIGILKASMAPMIPWVIAGNATYCILFAVILYLFKSRNNVLTKTISAIPAAFAKFSILSLGVRVIATLPDAMAKMMQGTQLVTALIGGVLAAILSELLKKTKIT